MRVKKDKTPYGADVMEFEAKVGRFNFKAHLFSKEGDISYELSLGNILQRFNNFSNIDKLKKSLDQEQERIDATKKFISQIENHLYKKEASKPTRKAVRKEPREISI
jgi:hypothetical protein